MLALGFLYGGFEVAHGVGRKGEREGWFVAGRGRVCRWELRGREFFESGLCLAEGGLEGEVERNDSA